ncbi:MAG TPA: hypothetical protein C5S50_10095, partial [Methanosarcinaceae archaeon]|nr:hypothetical protein [Methanosarcinaceae archaeon]
MIKLDFKNAVRLTVIMNLLDEAGYFGKHTIITATVHNMHSISTLPFFIAYRGCPAIQKFRENKVK